MALSFFRYIIINKNKHRNKTYFKKKVSLLFLFAFSWSRSYYFNLYFPCTITQAVESCFDFSAIRQRNQRIEKHTVLTLVHNPENNRTVSGSIVASMLVCRAVGHVFKSPLRQDAINSDLGFQIYPAYNGYQWSFCWRSAVMSLQLPLIWIFMVHSHRLLRIHLLMSIYIVIFL